MMQNRCISRAVPSKQIKNRSSGRIRAVSVVAFRESARAHRTTVLTGLATEFMHSWIRGSEEGPTDMIMTEISSITSDRVKIRLAHPMTEDWEANGIDGLRERLSLNHHSEAFIFQDHPAPKANQNDNKLAKSGSLRPIRTVCTAVNDEDDSVFCLIECEERLHNIECEEENQGGSDDQAVKKVEQEFNHQVYSIVKLDVLFDDTTRLVTAVTEMRQLGLADMALIAATCSNKDLPTPDQVISSSHARDSYEQESVLDESRMRDFEITSILQLPGSWDFPSSHIRKNRGANGASNNVEAATQSILTWCRAWQSGEDEVGLLKSCISQPEGGGSQDGMSQDHEGVFHDWIGWMKVLGWKGLASVVSEIKYKKEIGTMEPCVVDHAVSPDHNVGFSHWKGSVKAAGDEAAREVEGMSVYLFDEDGKIEDVWTLKSPDPQDRDMMKKACVAITSNMTRTEWA